MTYDLEIERVIKTIKEKKAERVLIQLPDGLKAQMETFIPLLEEKTDAIILTWFGTNFGACDLPIGVRNINVDLVIAFGHNKYIKDPKGW
tara:strand:- start:418 stop:687 length:270 start_codon:yes stop_codon:yes gene_type:complete